jgi:ElaB/YqjD/DUF883 family membrane-anchored ribosome-binding protein
MGQDPGRGGAEVTGTQEPEQIQREIEETREELGDTVEALARKADVRAQAQHKIEDVKASVSDKRAQLRDSAKEVAPDSAANAAAQVTQTAKDNPIPAAALGAFAAGFLAGRLSRR